MENIIVSLLTSAIIVFGVAIWKWILSQPLLIRTPQIIVYILILLISFQGSAFANPENDLDRDGLSDKLTATGKRTLLYLGNSANDDDRHGWYNETQGIANGDPAIGDNYWYLSKNIDSNRNTYIYRVNYRYHLADNFPYDKRRIRLPGGSKVCEHVGDIDYHVYKGVGYIVAPYEKCGDDKARIAFFYADDIDGSSDLLNPRSVLLVYSKQYADAPWVSVRNDGRIYSSRGGNRYTDRIYEYTIPWAQVAAGYTFISYSSFRTIYLYDENEDKMDLAHRQGADFSSDGQTFYIVNGYDGGDAHIHVFDVTNSIYWYRKDKSSKKSYPFKYENHCCDEEAQGLSFFDVSKVLDYHSQMPRGELHAVLLNNDIWGDDNVWIKHYTQICHSNNEYIPHGGGAFCTACGPCRKGEGDCDSNAECKYGLVCSRDVGPNYGWASWVDVCED